MRKPAVALAIATWLLSSQGFAQSAAAPYTRATRFNSSGQLTGTIEPDPDLTGPLAFRATRNTYGLSGQEKGLLIKTELGELTSWAPETEEPSSWGNYGFVSFLTKVFTYDSMGRKASERTVGSDGISESLTQFAYDDWGRVRCRVIRMNKLNSFASAPTDACVLGAEGDKGPDRITRFTYDKWDHVVTEERAVGTSIPQTYVTNSYNLDTSLLETQKDANGNLTRLEYFPQDNRLKRRYYPMASPSGAGAHNPNDYNEYAYDNNGNLTYERKRNGQSITYSIDANNRRTFKNLSDNTYSADVTYDYDLRGLTLSTCFGTSDDCVSSGEGETNAFDGLGNLVTRTSRTSTATRILAYRYDLEGNRTRVTHPDGWFFQYGFDGLNRFSTLGESMSAAPGALTYPLLEITYRRSGSRLDILRTGGANTNLARDSALRLLSFKQDFAVDSNDLTNEFQYNPANQVTKLTQSNSLYTFNELGSRSGAYTANGLNQYSNIAGTSLGYDDSMGNLTRDGTATFQYDMENHLVSTGGSGTASTLTYDVLGRLSRITVAGTTTDFHYDGDALVGEYRSGSLWRRYVHGDQVDEPLLQYNLAAVGVSARRYLHSDHQGTIIAHSSGSGAVLSKNAYDAYGVPAVANSERFGYTGQTWIPQLGLNYYKARFYSPKLGRFLQTDPIFYADDYNMYAYVGNDPINRVDPFGMEEQTICDKDPKSCIQEVEVVVEIDAPTSIDPVTGNLSWDALPPGVTEDQVSTTPEGKSDSPDTVDPNAAPTQSKIPAEAKNIPAANGAGPIGLEATLAAWDKARLERAAAQSRGDLDAAKRWDEIARRRMFDYNRLLPGKQELDPNLYDKPNANGR